MATGKFLNNIVLVGVGGAGMSAIAGMLHDLGYENIIGIDASESEITKRLKDRGINIIIGHGNYDIHHKDFVIYTDIDAVKQSPELKQSFAFEAERLKRHHKPYTYSEFLAEITKHFVSVSITGTNGKSSTTALAIQAATKSIPEMGLGIVGALMPDQDNKNYRINTNHISEIKILFQHIFEGMMPSMDLVKKYLFILEACEHKEHFLLYDNNYSLITNIGYDHQDYFPTQESYDEAFNKFLLKTKRKVVTTASVGKRRPGEKKIVIADSKKRKFKHVFGKHRQTNASLIDGLLSELKSDGFSVDTDAANSSIEEFAGLWRRMELLKSFSTGLVLYSDYGHHPEAISKAISSLKEKYPKKNIIAIIEPHQAQRLLPLREDFVQVLSGADQTIVYPVYHAREEREKIASLDKARELQVESFADIGFALTMEINGLYIDDANKLYEHLKQFDKDSVCIFFSAGKLDFQLRELCSVNE